MAVEIQIPGVDSKSGLELCDGDRKAYINTLRLFANGTPKDLEKMQSVSQENLADYAIAAHSVKSMSNYIGAEESKQRAKELELAAKGGNLALVQAKNEAFIKFAQGIVEDVRKWLESNEE